MRWVRTGIEKQHLRAEARSNGDLDHISSLCAAMSSSVSQFRLIDKHWPPSRRVIWRSSANAESPILVLRIDVLLNLLSGQGYSLRYTKRGRRSTSFGSRVSTSMSEKDQYKNRIELLQGTLDMLILQTLQWGPQHGYGIVQALRLRSGDVLQVETGSLYPALHRLERQSWVQSGWKQSESKQKARYYRITAKGKKQLASDLGRWERIVEAIGSVMYVKPEESES